MTGEIENLYSTGLPVLDVPPLIHRDLGAHLGSASIAAVDYIAGAENGLAMTTFVVGANSTRLIGTYFISPWYVCSLDRLAVEVTTGQTGTEVYLGLFDNGDIRNQQMGDVYAPSKLLFDSGSLSTASTGIVSATASPAIVLKPNRLYWVFMNIVAHATPATFRASNVGAVAFIGVAIESAAPPAMMQMSGTPAAAWGSGPVIPGATWALTGGAPIIRYRLIA